MRYPLLLLFFFSTLACSSWLCASAALAAPAAASIPATASVVEGVFQGKLVRPVENEKTAKATGLFVPFTSDRPYDYYLVYFSAHWCGPCRLFTPKLTQFYNDKHLAENGIQVVLVSRDYTEQNMWEYMVGGQMPWPALSFEWRDRLDFVNKLAGTGIPDLVLVDAAGNVLADTFDGAKYLGPDGVLDYVSRLLFQKEKEKSKSSASTLAPKNADELRDALGMDSLPIPVVPERADWRPSVAPAPSTQLSDG